MSSIDIGPNLYNLLSFALSIVYYEVRNYTNHMKHQRALELRLEKLERSKVD